MLGTMQILSNLRTAALRNLTKTCMSNSPYSLFILPANSFAFASVLSYAVSSSILPTLSITHTTHFLLLMSIPISLILFIISLRIVFDGSESAIIYQCARHRNAASRIAPFKLKCANHMFRGIDLSSGLQRGCFCMRSNYILLTIQNGKKNSTCRCVILP